MFSQSAYHVHSGELLPQEPALQPGMDRTHFGLALTAQSLSIGLLSHLKAMNKYGARQFKPLSSCACIQ